MKKIRGGRWRVGENSWRWRRRKWKREGKKMKISLNHLFTVVYILSPKNVASFMKNAPKPLWPTYRSMRALNMPEGINKEHGTLSLYFFQGRDRTREGWRGIESRGERERATDSNSIAEFATRFPLYPLHLSLPLPFRPLRISLVYPLPLSPLSSSPFLVVTTHSYAGLKFYLMERDQTIAPGHSG